MCSWGAVPPSIWLSMLDQWGQVEICRRVVVGSSMLSTTGGSQSGGHGCIIAATSSGSCGSSTWWLAMSNFAGPTRGKRSSAGPRFWSQLQPSFGLAANSASRRRGDRLLLLVGAGGGGPYGPGPRGGEPPEISEEPGILSSGAPLLSPDSPQPSGGEGPWSSGGVGGTSVVGRSEASIRSPSSTHSSPGVLPRRPPVTTNE